MNQLLLKYKELVNNVGISKNNFQFSNAEIGGLAKAAMSQQRLLQNNLRPINSVDAKKIYQTIFEKIIFYILKY